VEGGRERRESKGKASRMNHGANGSLKWESELFRRAGVLKEGGCGAEVNMGETCPCISGCFS
jgi:hypothetical protein